MEKITERLAQVIENDGNGVINRTLRVAESDVAAILGEFMEVNALDMRSEKTPNGYRLTVTVDVARFYDIGNTSERR